ncbi:MAG: hydrogenase small subunit [Syntrophales bacterium]|nr:hydrogenase small subunit [Syntrophales bacterium]MDD5640384.1 hydrogenase small subunit [Syntrophales bacterium]
MPKCKNSQTLPSHFGLVSRRDFLKFCGVAAAAMGLPLSMGAKIAEAVAALKRPPVIWLSGQECTGCTETLLRSTHPTVESLILDLISLDYHEALSTPSGHLAEEAKKKAIAANKGKFILVVEGAIPMKDNGIYCQIGGRTMLDILKETAPLAMGIVAIGSCASWGGIPSSGPNPTGAVGAAEALGGKFKVINIPGCPPNPYNFLSTVLYILTFKKLPDLDNQGRPRFAYRRLIHEGCERRPHFDAGRFALEYDDEGHRRGWCLYKLGCKGPETYNNCPAILFGNVGARSWPVGTGCPCFGCSEKGVGFTAPIAAQASLVHFSTTGTPFKGEERVGGGRLCLTPPQTFPPIHPPEGHGPSAATVGVLSGLTGVALGAGAITATKLGKKETESDDKAGKE